MQTLLGSPPINIVVFAIGKLAIVPHYIFVALWVAGLAPAHRLIPGDLAIAAAVALVLAGQAWLIVGVKQLGHSTRIGLPEEPTDFKTHGLYRFSRNPIYLGLFLSGIGSCLLVPHWFNIVSTLTMMAVHHRIVLSEERFLAERFGDAWHRYRAAVRRYL